MIRPEGYPGCVFPGVRLRLSEWLSSLRREPTPANTLRNPSVYLLRLWKFLTWRDDPLGLVSPRYHQEPGFFKPFIFSLLDVGKLVNRGIRMWQPSMECIAAFNHMQ
jgi:hypothetical protein